MRSNNQNKRSRNRGGSNRRQHGGGNPLTRNYESNGPDVKVRGNAATIAEKYVQLSRDAHSAGDSVLEQSYLQFAEHYSRIISAAQAYQQAQNQQRQERQEKEKQEKLRQEKEQAQEQTDEIADEKANNGVASDEQDLTKANEENTEAKDLDDNLEKAPKPKKNRKNQAKAKKLDNTDKKSEQAKEKTAENELPAFLTNEAMNPNMAK